MQADRDMHRMSEGYKEIHKSFLETSVFKAVKVTGKLPGEGRQSRCEFCKQRKQVGRQGSITDSGGLGHLCEYNLALLQQSTAKKEITKEQEGYHNPCHASMPHTCQ